MIQIKILQERYSCRTKDLFWYKEMRLAVELIVKEKKTLADIRWLSEQTNLYNAASSSRANEIRVVIARRINAVNDNFLEFYHNQTMDVQKILTVIMIMLTDRTFFEFMNDVYKEKLIAGGTELHDSDILGYFHALQEKDVQAEKWTDEGMKKVRDNYKLILKDSGMTSHMGVVRKILKPIISAELKDFLQKEGLIQIYRILAGVRG
ncbi:DUF1819 family protein [bacterium D16-54]|nr:DUF1819 family protein [bacterium D16-54]RKJ15168.1 DUF1819 family protein [bacterium D16-56]